MTAGELWNFLDPEEQVRTIFVLSEDLQVVIDEPDSNTDHYFSVYRTLDKVQQFDNRTGATLEISKRTLRAYFKDAREILTEHRLAG